MTSWFISDLHLDASRPATQVTLLEFLTYLQQAKADALYILGDFFEYWVGDDVLEDTALSAPLQPVIQALREVTQQGIPVYFLHGNRDFLVAEAFAKASGCQLLAEQVVALYGQPVLLLHGDTLCTDDVQYQQVRQLLRSEGWQQQFLALPIAERIRQAEEMRAQSQQNQQGQEMIGDVNQQAVEQALLTAGVSCMIHGHTHRVGTHEFVVNGQACQRIVLGDWQADRGSFLRVDAHGRQLLEDFRGA